MNLLKEYIEELVLLEKIRKRQNNDVRYRSSPSAFQRFSINKFKEIYNNEGINIASNYADETLTLFGHGSARNVYLLNSKTVLKISRDNFTGPAQNETEVDIYTNKLTKSIVAKIYDFDDKNYEWLVSELVNPVHDTDEFKKLTGADFYTFEDIIEQPELYINTKFNFKIEKFTQKILDLMKNTDLLPGDLISIEHWGKTSDQRVVLLDYGFTKKVMRDYYSADNSS